MVSLRRWVSLEACEALLVFEEVVVGDKLEGEVVDRRLLIPNRR